jgi:hypothetical protein
MADTVLRRQFIQIAMPVKGFIGSERITSTGYKVPVLDDAYLYNGEPTNRLTGAAQLIPNIQSQENPLLASALARAYPIQTTFKGMQSYGRAIDRSAKVSNPTDWKKSQL